MRGPKGKSFPTKPGGMFGPKPNIDRAQPLYLQADQLLYDTRNNRVIAQGNVEIYYNNYILTADQVVYDQGANKLIAEGNAQLKDPNGSITRADRFEALDDFRDAFIQSLSVVTADDTRIAAERASRREGNTTEYERGKFTPLQERPRHAAAVVHRRRAHHPRPARGHHHLPGRAVRAVRRADPVRALLPASRPVRQTPLGLPDADLRQFLDARASYEVPYYFALAPNYDFTFHPRYYSQGRRCCGRATGATGWRTASTISRSAAIDQEKGRSSIIEAGWRGSIETKGQFSLSSWWRFGWDVTADSDDSFRRFYKLDPIMQTDRVNTVYLQGMSERNYFAAKLYQFGGLLLTDTPYSNSWVHPVIDYNYIVGGPSSAAS